VRKHLLFFEEELPKEVGFRKLAACFCLFIFVLSQQAAWGWGNDGHMYVN